MSCSSDNWGCSFLKVSEFLFLINENILKKENIYKHASILQVKKGFSEWLMVDYFMSVPKQKMTWGGTVENKKMYRLVLFRSRILILKDSLFGLKCKLYNWDCQIRKLLAARFCYTFLEVIHFLQNNFKKLVTVV